MSGSSPPDTTPPDDASRHARAAARIVFGAMGVAVLIALAITLVGLRLRDAPKQVPAAAQEAVPTPPPPAATASSEAPVRVVVETFTTGTTDRQLTELASDLSDAAVEALRPLPGIVSVRRAGAAETTTAEVADKAEPPASGERVLVLRGTLTSSDERLRLDVSIVRDAEEGAGVELRIEQPGMELFALRAALTRELRRGVREVRATEAP